MRYCSSKAIDTEIKKLVKDGWTFKNGKKHGKLRHPSGKPTLTISKSPSDRRAFLNFQRDLRYANNMDKTVPC